MEPPIGSFTVRQMASLDPAVKAAGLP